MTSQNKIIVITAGGSYAWVIVNALANRFDNLEVLLEQPESKSLFLRRRARRVGWFQTAGQFGTMVISRFGKRFAQRRSNEIITTSGAQPELLPEIPVTRVSSANGRDCLELIAARQPDLVFLAGCRMLSKATLAAIPCPVINYHSGINPKYRGLAGGWWARATGDHENYGTTVHLVDAGVDTGGTLYQAFMKPDPRETLLTDSLAMAAGSRDIAVRAVVDALSGNLQTRPSNLPSVQRFHPPIWTYLITGLFKRVW
ncbi:formyl transferase-like protein [Hoeflea halophila]|uniref:phosphoribosylglycinamide formyltransferase 1 n=1 Tax=Hoeflea halophila TaxID=714899 RepID=A0A286HPL2_9HYPH|nr:formyl transferase [Hoeflea halophila]SOE09758.1 formyl transferase-like protein [Hoeflea halophila]